jgi:hypothetical protein
VHNAHGHPIIGLDWTHIDFNDFISAHPRERLFFQVAITIIKCIDGSLESLLNAIIIPVGSQETWFFSLPSVHLKKF